MQQSAVELSVSYINKTATTGLPDEMHKEVNNQEFGNLELFLDAQM